MVLSFLAVILGERGTKIEYTLLAAGSYLGVLVFYFAGAVPLWGLMPVLSLPLGISLVRRIWRETSGPELNQVLAATAGLSLIFSLLLAFGLVLERLSL